MDNIVNMGQNDVMSNFTKTDDIMNDKKFKQLAPWNEEVKAEIKHRTANLKK